MRRKKKSVKEKVPAEVTIEEFESHLTKWQRASFRSQVKRDTLARAGFDEEEEVLVMTLKNGHVQRVKPPKYLAPRFRRVVIAAAIATAVWLDKSGRLPLVLHGFYEDSSIMEWSLVLGVFVGFMSAWPHRHPHPQKFLQYLTVAAAAFEMHELFEHERHHHESHTRSTTGTR